jgi:hypothetical protein
MSYVVLFVAAAVVVIVIGYTVDDARVVMNAAVDRVVELGRART